ncbi:MAG TPA: GNAT family N-acetyltransferase [Ktedonobacteraceae bacterium]|nr:GNAT family N-acetyltransferase [Ktedonobacteraceae bacterium]
MNIDTGLSIWQGKLIRLRATEPSDWETFFAWDQDVEQSRRLYFIPFPQSQERTRHFVEKISTQRPEDDGWCFEIEDKAGELVGNLTTNQCDRRVGNFRYGIAIKQGHRGKGYASEAILLVLRYYFQELRYQKVTISVYSFNEASIRLHEKLGFLQEGCIRRTVFTRGQYYDELVYGMTVEEFASKHPEFAP